MGYLSRIAKFLGLFVLFFLFLGFGLRNTDLITVRLFLGQEWRAPLSLVLLVFFGGGAILGVLASLGIAYRQRRELATLRRRADAHSRARELRARRMRDAPIV